MSSQRITYLESRLYTSDGASRATGLALQEKKSSIFLKDCVRRTTCMTCNILLDISPKNVLYLLLLEATFDNQLTVTVNRAARTQLGQQKVQ